MFGIVSIKIPKYKKSIHTETAAIQVVYIGSCEAATKIKRLIKRFLALVNDAAKRIPPRVVSYSASTISTSSANR